MQEHGTHLIYVQDWNTVLSSRSDLAMYLHKNETVCLDM